MSKKKNPVTPKVARQPIVINRGFRSNDFELRELLLEDLEAELKAGDPLRAEAIIQALRTATWRSLALLEDKLEDLDLILDSTKLWDLRWSIMRELEKKVAPKVAPKHNPKKKPSKKAKTTAKAKAKPTPKPTKPKPTQSKPTKPKPTQSKGLTSQQLTDLHLLACNEVHRDELTTNSLQQLIGWGYLDRDHNVVTEKGLMHLRSKGLSLPSDRPANGEARP